MRRHTVDATKRSDVSLDTGRVVEGLVKLAERSIGKTHAGWGWFAKVSLEHQPDVNGHTYNATVALQKRQQREREQSEEVFARQLGTILPRLLRGLRTQGWEVRLEGADEATQTALAAAAPASGWATPPKADAPGGQRFDVALPAELAGHFAHIFDRDAQIRIVHSAIQTAVATNFTVRNHVLLFGKPACGKTEILSSFERLLGSDFVLRLDATSTSKAGAENLLLQLERIPPVILLEEAEKTDPGNLYWLLGIMDTRGELVKTTARIGSVRKEARCLVLATVNDLPLFQRLMSGALASRFQHQLYCPRPTREVLHKILSREVDKMGGNPAWIEPALDFCLSVEKTNDPRRILAVLDGRDRLLDGSYQADLLAIREAMERDEAGL